MKVYHFKRSQELPITQDVAWAFFANPANLMQLSPPWAHLKDESWEHPKSIYPGLVQVYRLKLLGWIPCRWITNITHVDAPSSFVDEQKSGPFGFWQHRHEIVPAESGVAIVDTVHYSLPPMPFPALVHWVIRKQLDALFDYRADMLDEFFS